jgi:hypothetical protein
MGILVILVILSAMIGGGWWLLDHYHVPPFTRPPATVAADGTPPSVTRPTTSGGAAASACASQTDAIAAATAAAVPRPTVTALTGSWVAYSPALRIRFFGMPWWDERPAASHGMRYQVGTVPDSPDFDQLDVLRVPGTGGAASTSTWQTELDTYMHRSTAGSSGALNDATIGNVVVTVRPHPQRAAGYDGYIGQFHFTENAGQQIDATLWVGQVGCDRVLLLFTGPPTREQQIGQAVTQVLGTIDFSAR